VGVRIVVAPDKFKGTLTASEAARAMAAGASRAHPGAEVIVVPAADGGEGTLDALVAAAGGATHAADARDPLGRPITAPVALLGDGRVALESATACGLGLLDVPAPTRASSMGVGDLIRRALDLGDATSTIVVGVGGTASTDGGTGAACALGWRFLDRTGADLPPGGGALESLHAVDGARVDGRLARRAVVAACDVVHRLTGPRGAAAVFGPQKGASGGEVAALGRGLERLAEVIARDLGLGVADVDHGGAGGGLGAGLAAFFGAELVSGFDFVARATGLHEEIARADIVVTGEGRVDASSSAGKVVSGVVARAVNAGARAVVIAGEIDPLVDLSADALWIDLRERYGAASRSTAAECVTRATAEILSD
jgi:glycerate 2-kinase